MIVVTYRHRVALLAFAKRHGRKSNRKP
jgi:hypothetical protein